MRTGQVGLILALTNGLDEKQRATRQRRRNGTIPSFTTASALLMLTLLGACGVDREPTAPTVGEPSAASARTLFRLASIDAGGFQTCGVTKGRPQTYCWGSDFSGELGNGPPLANTNVPSSLAGGVTFTQVSAGTGHSCGLTSEGKAYCWGGNSDGQLGTGAPFGSIGTAPAPVAGGFTFTQLSAGGRHTCGLNVSGQAYCWGSDLFGQLGNGAASARVNTPSSVAGGLTFTQISTGLIDTCAITQAGKAYCWGSDFFGELGNGFPQAQTSAPSPVSGGLVFMQVSAGSSQTCGVTTRGQAYCWGLNANGQLGTGVLSGSNVPSPVAGGLTFIQVSVGSNHSCGVTRRGEAYCWGLDNFGQLGNGSPLVDVNAPSLVAGGLRFITVTAGLFHTCGITRGGRQAYCWGLGNSGELGNGVSGSMAVPSPVSAPVP
jgi:alpha-tubulin suppressor-like RCC1 family protein